ncbi:MAG: hypothetical protein NTX64_08185 [Elusimicrobia bacterium]|nr:hypothetical protein [Elusimicrobiota bacterium]
MKNTALVMIAGLATILLSTESRAASVKPDMVVKCRDGQYKPKGCCKENKTAAAQLTAMKGIQSDACKGTFSHKDLGKKLEDLANAEETSADGDKATKATKCGKTCIQYDDGEQRSGGTRAWRNNNPGNIEYGQFARDHGAIGTDGRFAVFPDEQTGSDAMQSLLQDKYGNKSISQMVYRYAPPGENDSAGYANSVARAAGVSSGTKINTLSDSQFTGLVKGMKRIEGWRVGRVVYN